MLLPTDCHTPPTISHGTTDVLNGTVYNAVARIRCDIGFKRNGTSSLRCEESGRWSDAGTCDIKGYFFSFFSHVQSS